MQKNTVQSKVEQPTPKQTEAKQTSTSNLNFLTNCWKSSKAEELNKSTEEQKAKQKEEADKKAAEELKKSGWLSFFKTNTALKVAAGAAVATGLVVYKEAIAEIVGTIAIMLVLAGGKASAGVAGTAAAVGVSPLVLVAGAAVATAGTAYAAYCYLQPAKEEGKKSEVTKAEATEVKKPEVQKGFWNCFTKAQKEATTQQGPTVQAA